ncbi:ROK family transcriptional regulator [Primorskyibacter sp. 2E233]|uniref:ROK family transcriptional regulator n=1 Tax=Primorskyibacter sp. 2E233 TaxID=3413431 RepID=UPI003BF31F4C
MRAHNERLVLTILRRHGPMAKAEIARATGLSAQTVSVMMRRLEEEGFLRRGEPLRGKVGQPSVPMRLAGSGAYFGGLKIGRRSADLVLTDFLGKVMSRARITYDFPRPEATVRFACDTFKQLSGQLDPVKRARIAGLGVAMPFRLWDWATSLGLAPEEMEGWRDYDIATELENGLDLPIFMQNDASAACGAELVFGAEDRASDFLYFYLGYFAGGGVVLNNQLFTGRNGNAGALGSIPVPDGQGGLVQLIDRASLCVLERAMRAADHETASLWEPPAAWDVPPGILSNWVQEAGRGLAHAIVSSVCVLDLSEVMIDGWLPTHVRDDLVTMTNAALDKMDLSGIQRPTVRPGHVGPDARVLGAASLPLSHRFLIE